MKRKKNLETNVFREMQWLMVLVLSIWAGGALLIVVIITILDWWCKNNV